MIPDKKVVDRDIEGLRLCIEGMEMVSLEMKPATINFLVSKYLPAFVLRSP